MKKNRCGNCSIETENRTEGGEILCEVCLKAMGLEGSSDREEKPIDEGFIPDNWKHRSKGMTCATCMWYVEKKSFPSENGSLIVGRCRKHCPTMNGYPAVFPTDWCGDHKLDETKL